MVVAPIAAPVAELALSTALGGDSSVHEHPGADSELLPMQYRLGGETVDLVELAPEAMMAMPDMVADRAGEFAENHPILAFGAGMTAAAAGAVAYKLPISQIVAFKMLDSLSKALIETAPMQWLGKRFGERQIAKETKMWRDFEEGIRSGRIKPTEPKWTPEERLQYEIAMRRREAKSGSFTTFGKWEGWQTTTAEQTAMDVTRYRAMVNDYVSSPTEVMTKIGKLSIAEAEAMERAALARPEYVAIAKALQEERERHCFRINWDRLILQAVYGV